MYYTETMASDLSKDIGKIGETIAANYLRKEGYQIEAVNFSNEIGYRIGEIDIVAYDPKEKEFVFFEVKTLQKAKGAPQNPELAINRSKYRKLSRIIGKFLRWKKAGDAPHRIDAIAIELDLRTRKADLRHLKYIYY